MNIKILIVEDEQIIRSLLVRMITKKFPSCVVIEAENGAKGIKAVEAENPDVVFLDVNMPVMNGFETLSLIRKIPRFKSLPVFIMTSVSERDIVVKFMRLGIRGYILKPLEKSIVYARLDKIANELRLAGKLEVVHKRSILFVGGDETFATIFTDTFSPFAEIRTANTVQDALRLSAERAPTDVCIAESDSIGSGEIDERIAAGKLKNIGHSKKEIRTYLLNQSGLLRQEETRFFTGAVKRSLHVAELFDSVARVIFERRNIYEKIQILIHNITARQLYGIIGDFSENLSLTIKITDVKPKFIKCELEVVASIILPDSSAKIIISIGGEKNKFLEIVRRTAGDAGNTLEFCAPLLRETQSEISNMLGKYGIEAGKIEIQSNDNTGASSIHGGAVPEISKVIEFDGGIKLYFSLAIQQ